MCVPGFKEEQLYESHTRDILIITATKHIKKEGIKKNLIYIFRVRINNKML